MISAVITIKVKMNRFLVLIMFSMIIHLGKNPKKGGSPPNDIKFIKKQNFMIGMELLKRYIWLILNKLKALKIMIIERLIIKYTRK